MVPFALPLAVPPSLPCLPWLYHAEAGMICLPWQPQVEQSVGRTVSTCHASFFLTLCCCQKSDQEAANAGLLG
jgi:hypothetical protein